MKKIVHEINEILATFNHYKPIIDDNGLHTGLAGQILFKSLYLKHFFTEGEDVVLAEQLNYLVSKKSQNNNHTFCTGSSGIDFLFSIMHENNLISNDDFALLSNNDKILNESSLIDFKNGQYDYLHGGIGTAYYILNYRPYNASYFNKIISLLNIMRENKFRIFIDDNKIDDYNIVVNLGLAHGLPSILKFLVCCVKKNICKDICIELSRVIIKFLKDNISYTDVSLFPSIIYPSKSERENNSRLGWCYGDLSIGFILYQAASELEDNEIKDFALDILLHTTKRKNQEDTMIMDGGLCHGSAGVAHIYNKIWSKTGNICFKESCDYWIEQTVEHIKKHTSGKIYRGYNSINHTYEPDESLLSGSTGIGLVFLTYLTGDFSWDFSIMLN